MAKCLPGGAYLVYWSANVGYQVDGVVRGPAQVASVTFENTTTAETMRVTCQGGTPVAHLWHDE